MIKTVKLEIEGNFFDMMKGIYKKPTAYIITNTERLNAYTLRDQEQNRDVCSCYFCSVCTRGLSKTPWQLSKKNKKKKDIRLEMNK